MVGAGSSGPVPVSDFAEHVFGVFLLNDWSSRDLQAWESQPLGPFLAKSFATSVSPWVVPLEALEHARVSPPPRDPEPLPYLADAGPWGLDLALEVRLNGQLVARPPFATTYWTAPQMLAHMTVNGASTRTGDLFASGTVSGPERDQRGCLLELSWGGAEPLTLADGSVRSFLEDGDEVAISATAPAADGTRIGFGEVTGQILRPRSARLIHCRSFLRSSLPTLVSGTMGTIVISRGYLLAARCRLACSVSSSAVASAPGRSDTNATTSSPSRASGRPTTPACATAGWASSTSSTSRGKTLKPPRRIRSFLRSTTYR